MREDEEKKKIKFKMYQKEIKNKKENLIMYSRVICTISQNKEIHLFAQQTMNLINIIPSKKITIIKKTDNITYFFFLQN